MIDGQASGAPSHHSQSHGRPSQVDWPSFGNGELNNTRHEEKSQAGESCSEPQDQEYREYDLAAPGEKSHYRGSRKVIGPPRQMQLELGGKQIDGCILQSQEPGPLENAGTAPPAGRRRMTTSMPGLVMSASSAALE
jgi:hypothetical protein